MAVRFLGNFEHSLDPKGRLILPAKFRPALSPTTFISQYLERCLALWTPEAFEVMADHFALLEQSTAENRKFARTWARNAWDMDVDAQGRIQIPAELRAFARLESTVIVNGALSHVELWSPDGWAEAGASGDELLASPPEGLPLLSGRATES